MRSTTAPGSIWIAGASDQGPWLLSIDHSGVVAEIGAAARPRPFPGPALATFIFADRDASSTPRSIASTSSRSACRMHRSLASRSRPPGLPRTTEAERLVVQRIGQNVFRDALMDYWGGRCPLTGITEPALLRASHIVPWADCNDAQRLDVHNGLLLSALWDAAFDQGLVSFADDGTPLASPKLSEIARKALGLDAAPPLRGLQDAHRANLSLHRTRYGF